MPTPHRRSAAYPERAASAWPRWSAFAVFVCVLLSLHGVPAYPQQADNPTVTLEAVHITPATPAPASLCRLVVTIANHGTQPASRFRFSVRINGRLVDAYVHTKYLQAIAPGRSADIPLYNFWSTEASGAAAPTLEVDVAATGADWVKSATGADGVAVWSPVGPIAGLPSAKRLAISMTASLR